MIIGHWKLDESAGAIIDVTGNGNDGTVNGGATYSPYAGILKGALDLDGIDDFIEVANESAFDFDRDDTFSLSAWVYYYDTTLFRIIFGKVQNGGNFPGYELHADATNERVRFRLVGGGGGCGADCINVFSPLSSLSRESWNHVLVTYDGSSSASGVNIYINGQLQVPNVASDGLVSSVLNNTQLRIGDTAASAGDEFTGRIDDVRVYNRALSAQEALQLYNMGLSDGLVAGWHFNEGAGSDAIDYVSNDTDGGNLPGLASGGKIDAARDWNGTDDYIRVSNNKAAINNVDTFTYTAWIYPHSFGENERGHLLQMNGAGGTKIQFRMRNDDANETFRAYVGSNAADAYADLVDYSISLNNWQHIAVTYDDAGDRYARVYINGVEGDYQQWTPNMGVVFDDSANHLFIGADGTGVDAFDGLIDELRLYNRILSEEEIRIVMGAGADCQNPASKVGGISYTGQNGHVMMYCSTTGW
jgi:hypothetical protein